MDKSFRVNRQRVIALPMEMWRKTGSGSIRRRACKVFSWFQFSSTICCLFFYACLAHLLENYDTQERFYPLIVGRWLSIVNLLLAFFALITFSMLRNRWSVVISLLLTLVVFMADCYVIHTMIVNSFHDIAQPILLPKGFSDRDYARHFYVPKDIWATPLMILFAFSMAVHATASILAVLTYMCFCLEIPVDDRADGIIKEFGAVNNELREQRLPLNPSTGQAPVMLSERLTIENPVMS